MILGFDSRHSPVSYMGGWGNAVDSTKFSLAFLISMPKLTVVVVSNAIIVQCQCTVSVVIIVASGRSGKELGALPGRLSRNARGTAGPTAGSRYSWAPESDRMHSQDRSFYLRDGILGIYTVRSSDRLVGQTHATSDWSVRPVGPTGRTLNCVLKTAHFAASYFVLNISRVSKSEGGGALDCPFRIRH